MNRLVITAPPPTPNGPLHLGHVAGPYLAADLAARHARASGAYVTTVCGIDSYQDYVDVAARAAGQRVGDYVVRQADGIERDFEHLDIAWDVFARPDQDQDYRDAVRALFADLVTSGAVGASLTALSRCRGCRVLVQYAGASGRCASCHTPSGGGPCEGCARYTPASRLQSVTSTCCGAPLVDDLTEALVFRPRDGWESVQRAWLPEAASSSPVPLVRRASRMPAEDLPGGYVAAIPAECGTRGVTFTHGNREYVVDVWFEMGLFYASLAGSATTSTELWHFLRD